MPPIQVHTKSPINAAKASGITPKTTTPEDKDKDHAQPASPTLTSPPSNQRYQPTPTQTTPPQGPPPPQPGAVPRLPQATATATSSASTLPPPPQAGAAAPPAPTAAPVLGSQIPGVTYPPQMAIPPPQAAYNQRGTATAEATGATGGYYSQQPQQQQQFGYGSNNSSGYAPPQQYQEEGEGEEGFLGSAMKYAKAAGERLSAAESEVWRRINGEKSQ